MVLDIEEMDKMLNNVLNQETQRVGGRVLITVGDAEIDLSPTFVLFLVTRDPTFQLTPDLSSRVTLINYTTTPSSLMNKVRNYYEDVGNNFFLTCFNLIVSSLDLKVGKTRG